ncbi:ABC transporter substrate-binding protein [Natranaeroarchaeum aerophilus]|uniref:ABC transporter substrate-binding protein n=1 Tax=Natranaeroarchaeum aerophilus TaxID=2917711 RepID=A0AAE3FT90_9EURY|nr:ABC transporter substrate-binding protein [Natranaeroarchaeum aerophilus]MCL9814899.1 ABC transporter substrate-binding protein [Natranaeroarchaeum aerophilus]
MAGCFGGDEEENGEENGDENGTATEDPGELEDLQEGGHLRAGVGSNVDSFDPPYSNDTTSTLSQSLIFESLATTDNEGNLYPWLAEDWEVVDAQDVAVDGTDYEPYMRTITAGEEGVVDTDGQQEVVRHPQDLAPEEGDEVRTLLFEDAADAVEDGTYGVHIRYHLREGVEFHNGEEVTAENVVASYDRIQLSDVDAQYFDSTLYYEEIDEYTVDIYAQVPDAEAERELPPLYVYTVEQAELPNGELDPRQGNDPIGTGPYEFVEMEDEQYVDYEKSDSYWVEEMGVDSIDWFDGPEAYPDGPVIDEVSLEIIPDDATRSGALQDDEIDVTTGLASATLNDFDADDEFTVTAVETGGYTYLQPPVNVEPWDDQRLRQAFNKLVPRDLIVENIFDGWARPAFTMIPELAQGAGTADAAALEDDVRHYNEYDPEEASEMVQEVFDDYGIEAPLEVQLETNVDNDDRVAMVELIAESMQETGLFETTVETYEWTTYLGRVLDPEYGERGHIAGVGLSGTFNPHSFCDALHHSSNVGQCCNLAGISEDWIDEALDNARYGAEVAEDVDLRRERYDELFRDLEEYAGSAVTHFGVQESVLTADLSNWAQWPFHEDYLSYALYAPADERVAWFEA